MGGSTRSLPSGTVAFLLSDIEGSTALLRELGDGYDQVLTRHRVLIRAAIAAHGGVEVGTEGDSFLVAFDDLAASARCARDAQRALVSHSWPGSGLRVRMGIHVGSARVVEDDYVSLALHQATRILSTAHGGQIILSGSAASAVEVPDGCALVPLGRYRVRDFDQPEPLSQLDDPHLPRTFPPPRASSARVQNLPSQRTSFVGRQHEVELVAKLVDRERMVSIVGPGGVGKTRLICHVGDQLAAYADIAVWFVGLAGVGDESSVHDAVVAAVDEAVVGDETRFEAMCRRLASESSLLLIDNCEHVAGACAQLIEDLLERCPSLHVLLSTREPIRLVDEHVFELATMEVPSERAAYADTIAADAVVLFAERARQASRAFEVDETNATQIAAICRALDGLPLALELTAARMFEMSVSELAERIVDPDSLLSAARRGGDARHQTIRAAIDWSRDRLEPSQQQLFDRLAVFRGGFTADAASAIVGHDLSESSLRSILDVLVRVSLLDRQPEFETPRLRMLEPVRQYADSRLPREASDEFADRHKAWYADLATEAANNYHGAELATWFGRLDDDRDNLYAAFARALTSADVTTLVALVEGLSAYWMTHGAMREGIDRADQALDLELSPHERARLLLIVGELSVGLRDVATADHSLREAESLFSATGDDRRLARAFRLMGYNCLLRGEFERSSEMYLLAVEKFRRIGDLGPMLFSYCGLSEVELYRHDPDSALRYVEVAMPIAVELEDVWSVTSLRMNLAEARLGRGEIDEAREEYVRARDGFRDLGYGRCVANTLLGLGKVAYAEGDLSGAQEAVREAIAEYKRANDVEGESEGLCLLAWFETFDGAVEEAQDHLRRATTLFDGPLEVPMQQLVQARIDRLTGNADAAQVAITALVARAALGQRSPNPTWLSLEQAELEAAVAALGG